MDDLWVCKHHDKCDGKWIDWNGNEQMCRYKYTLSAKCIWRGRSKGNWFRIRCYHPEVSGDKYGNSIAIRWRGEK